MRSTPLPFTRVLLLAVLSLFLIPTDAAAQEARFNAPKGYDRASDVQPQGQADAQVLPGPKASVLRGGLSEGFDDVGSLPDNGWAIQNNSEPEGVLSWFQGNPDVFPSQSGADTSYIAVNFNSGADLATLSNWLITPEIDLENGTEMTFWARAADGGFPDRLQVRMSTEGASTDVGTGATDVGDFTELLLDINPDYEDGVFINEWVEYTVTVSGLDAPTTGRFAFRYFVEEGGPFGSNSDFVGIDEVSVTGGGGGAPLADFSPSVMDGLDVTVAPDGTADGSLTISNDGDADLDFSFPEFVGAARQGADILLEEDFEGTFPPADWTTEDVTGECPWLTSDDYPLDGWVGEARGAAIDADECGSGTEADANLITPAMDLSGATDTHLEFDFAYRQLTDPAIALDVSTDGGDTWTEIMVWSENVAYPDEASAPVGIDLSAYDGESSVTLRWRWQSGWDWWAFVDNVVVTSGGDEPPAEFVTAVTPAMGTVAPGESVDVDVTVDATGFMEGTYDQLLGIETNEPASYDYPVSMTVQEGGAPITIAEAREAGVGATVTVQGVVTRAKGDFTYFQDETAGLTIRQVEGAFFDDVADGTIAEGTEIEVTGTLSAFAELLQINEGDLDSYEVLGDGDAPAPQTVTLDEIVTNGEDYEAELIQVADLTIDGMGTFEAATSYTVTDATESDTLRVPNADDSDIDGTDIPEGEFTFTGVVGQFSFDGPGLGYQLLAIEETDIEVFMPGALEFDPSPLVEMLNAGETGTETVSLINNTDGEVTFDFVQYSGEGLDKAPPTSSEPSLDLDKGEDDPRGYVQRFGAGGPDEFGYEWIDSNEPGGPAFEAIDISETGTELTEADFDPEECTFDPLDEGNALVELPFDFSFYGETYSSVKVNINGHLNFNADGAPIPCAFTNDPMPDTGTPNGGLVAPLWDDYDASPEGAEGGQIFYETLADGRFVVQYHNIEKFANDTEPNTFQVILSPSGAIKYQYVDLNSTSFTYSIGIENPDGTIGLEVAMGSGYAENGLAVLIQARPSFVTGVSPATGSIPAGGSADVDVDFSAEGLIGGTYEGVINVETNLADPSGFELPVELEVTGMAACAISPDPVEFEDTIVGFSTSEEVTVSNGGSDSCELTDASADAPFSVDGFEATTLAPGQETSFTVVYTPTAAGDDSGTLTVTSPEGDLTAGLEGTGLEPPSFSVDPTSLSFEVEAGTVSDAQTLTLSNTGDGAGAFSVSVANATRRGLTPSLDGIDPIVTLNAPETAALLAQIEDKPIVNARSGVTLTAKPGSSKLSATKQSSVLRGGGNPGDLIASTPTIASISGFGQTPDGTIYVCDLDAGATTETFTFDGSSFTSTGSFTQPGTPGTNITGCTYYPDGDGGDGAIWFLNADLTAGTATFIETDLAGTPTGATVPVTGLPAGATPIGLSYNEATGQFFLLDIGGDDILSIGTDGAVIDSVPQTCLDDGSGLFGNALDALGGALDVLVGTSADARPTRVQVTEFDGSCRDDGQGNDLFTPITVTEDAFMNGVMRDRSAPNEVMYLGANSDLTVYAVVPAERDDIGSFITVDPEEGTVDAGGDQDISVTVDATDLDEGSYSADIVIETNDPDNPTITVPVTVEVVIIPSNENDGVPTEFALGQNYPNPFASRTTIDYALPEAARVTITVYDAVGRRVAVLVDEDATAGYHSAEWDTRGLASGVYLYRIQAGDYAKTRKMSIVR